jgi:hypothetical protein
MSVRGPDYVEEATSSRLHCFIGYAGHTEDDIYSVNWYWLPDNYFKSKENQVFKPSKDFKDFLVKLFFELVMIFSSSILSFQK